MPNPPNKTPKLSSSGAALETYQKVSVQRPGEVQTWAVPEEVPVAFVYNGRNYAVMMATPLDLADYAIGFSLTEQIVDDIADIVSIHVDQRDIGVELRIEITPASLERFDVMQRRRNLVGRASCGICGLDNADRFFQTLPTVAETPCEISTAALELAAGELPQHQPLNDITKTVHGAVWAGLDGHIQMVREDVGRHNALDKLLGALSLFGQDMTDGFVLMTSRCSYEIIEKAARCGVTALAAISGPTHFALQNAREANMTLYCRSGSGFVKILNNA